MSQASDSQPAPRLVLSTTPATGVRVLSFARPEKRNALSQAVIDQFLGELSQASTDPAIKVIVVTGTHTLFSAGADIKEIALLDEPSSRASRYLEDLCLGIRAVEKPVIAAVEGMALGGGFEVALMCDVIYASSTATFGLPEVKIGLIPGAGGTQRLTSAMGKYRAMQVILFGLPITATEAQSYGLLAGIFEPGTVLQEVIQIATQLAQQSGFALALAKKAVIHADELGQDGDFERDLYYSAFSAEDKVEGVSAFLQKRKPNWS